LIEMKTINFHGAAIRHYVDATLLQQNLRQANAGQLYGFVAECGLKSLLVAAGLTTEPDGDIAKVKPGPDFRWHADRLANQLTLVQTFLEGRKMAGYLSQIPDIGNFSDWNTDHRYYEEACIPASLEQWRVAASQVMKMLDVAMADGAI
jgi:hypothetical protein